MTDAFLKITKGLIDVIMNLFIFTANAIASIIPTVDVSTITLTKADGQAYNTAFFSTISNLISNNSKADYAFNIEKWGPIMVTIGGFIVAFNLAWELFRAFFGKITESDEPLKILFTGIVNLIKVTCFYVITNLILSVIFLPLYKIFKEDGEKTVDSIYNMFKRLPATTRTTALLGMKDNSLASTVAQLEPTNAGTSLLCGLIFFFLSGVAYLSFLNLCIEIAERYIVMFLLLIFGPVCVSFGSNAATASIEKSYWSCLFVGFFLLLFSVFSIYTYLLGFMSFGSAMMDVGSKGLVPALAKFILLYAWGRGCMAIDEYMSAVGFSLIRSGSTGADLVHNLQTGGALKAMENSAKTMGSMINAPAKFGGKAVSIVNPNSTLANKIADEGIGGAAKYAGGKAIDYFASKKK